RRRFTSVLEPDLAREGAAARFALVRSKRMVADSSFGLRREWASEPLSEHSFFEMIDQLAAAERFGGEAVNPCNRAFESFQFGHSIGEKVPIVCGCILPEQVPHQAVDQSTHAIRHSGDRKARYTETRRRSEREVVQPAKERSGTVLPFHIFECCAEVRMSREHVALLTRWRREPVAPERNLVNDRGKLWTGRKVRLNTRGEDDEIECKGASFSFNLRGFSFVADRVPCAIGMPREIFKPAATPKGILGWR